MPAYPDCWYCGGEVCEQRVGREVWRAGKLHLIEDVPTGVCRQCGEKFVLPDTARAIDRILAGFAPDRIVSVPAFRFPNPTATLSS